MIMKYLDMFYFLALTLVLLPMMIGGMVFMAKLTYRTLKETNVTFIQVLITITVISIIHRIADYFLG